MHIKKIVILGPESTGKSTLCTQLAEHYNSIWVREYAREYLLQKGMDYTAEDLLKIAAGQLQSEEEAVQELQRRNGSLLFIDTDMYVIKIWSEIVFNTCDNRILNELVKRAYDLYLLCDTDLPWIKDELREYPELRQRQRIYQFYLDAMVNQHVPWVNINGGYDERLQKAIHGIDAFTSKHYC